MAAPATVPGQPVAGRGFDSRRLERVFNLTFAAYNTRLAGGAEEPLYEPAPTAGGLHTLYYRHDYFASALHETAHWCIAGEARRRQVDFGYWYCPDGRDAAAQQAFEAVEAKPQALEWLFSQACGYPFILSLDNLALGQSGLPETEGFRRQVVEQAQHWQKLGLPPRAQQFFSALGDEFSTYLELARCVVNFSPDKT